MHDFPLWERAKEQWRILSLKKVYNVVLSYLQLLIKASRLYYYPTRLTIETGNICNLKCPLCPTGRGDPGAQRGFIALPEYKKVIDELADDLILVRLYNWGEPLLHKDIVPMVEYAVGKGVGVTLSTNLTILDRETARGLLAAGLNKLFVSADGASEETYQTYHVGGSFERVMANLKLLISEKETMGSSRTRIVWLFHVFRHNEREIDLARKKAAELGVEIRFNPMRTDMGREIFEKASESIERDFKWIPENPKFCLFDLDKREAKRKRNFCSLPWKEAVINWDGSVLPCCSVYEGKYTFGNAFEEGFKKIWNGPSYRAARLEMAGRPNAPRTVCHICKDHGFTYL